LFLLLAWIAAIQPTFLEPGPFLAFLKRAAPLAILAAGQYYVIRLRRFDLSVGSLVTVVVVVAAKLLGGEDTSNVPVIVLLLAMARRSASSTAR
jgi:ribose transport system permease protein